MTFQFGQTFLVEAYTDATTEGHATGYELTSWSGAQQPLSSRGGQDAPPRKGFFARLLHYARTHSGTCIYGPLSTLLTVLQIYLIRQRFDDPENFVQHEFRWLGLIACVVFGMQNVGDGIACYVRRRDGA